MESNAWCPRLTAAMILSGSAVHVKGFGSALVSARKRLMAAWRSTTGAEDAAFQAAGEEALDRIEGSVHTLACSDAVQAKWLFIQKSFCRTRKPCGPWRICSSRSWRRIDQEEQMRPIAIVLGAAAVIGFAASGSAEPGQDRIQLAQSQESGAQTGAAAGAKERGGAANRDNSGAATTRSSQGGGAAAGAASSGERTTVRQETQGTNRTSVRTRSEGARVSVRGGSRTAVGRSVARDDAVIIKRKKAGRYVYSEPSTTVVRKKKRYVHYSEPSRTVVIKKRRPGVAIDTGVSTRTTVRSRTSTVGGSSASRETVRSGPSERSGGQGSAGAGGAASSTTGGGAASSTEGRAQQGGGRSGSGSPGRSGPSGSGEAPATR